MLIEKERCDKCNCVLFTRICNVCKKELWKNCEAIMVSYGFNAPNFDGEHADLCSHECMKIFAEDPEKYLHYL